MQCTGGGSTLPAKYLTPIMMICRECSGIRGRFLRWRQGDSGSSAAIRAWVLLLSFPAALSGNCCCGRFGCAGESFKTIASNACRQCQAAAQQAGRGLRCVSRLSFVSALHEPNLQPMALWPMCGLIWELLQWALALCWKARRTPCCQP